MNYYFTTQIKKILSDTHTPVELYLKLRDKTSQCFLLESSDYKSKENSFSYLCIDPVASFVCEKQKTTLHFPNQQPKVYNNEEINIAEVLHDFTQQFDYKTFDYDFITQGLFGYTSYDAIPCFEDISFTNEDFDLPLIQYHLFRHLIVFNHFNNELYLIEHTLEGQESELPNIEAYIKHRAVSEFDFETQGNERSNFSDEDFLEKINIGKKHCFRGDVFQVVLSRKFKQDYLGDEFNVYRALRSINPSPYLFYFDYGNFKIFGSSPEAQLVIAENKATINPIAGTFKRTGTYEEDQKLATLLLNDPKENAEHVMLVDLARNDLSINSQEVKVERLKEIEFYSHVIHLVSSVTAQLAPNYNSIKILGDTYPAGTLSGAPKHKAMQIIDEHEPNSRGFYGGAVGYLGLNGEFNHAIFIRSFLAHHQELTYQAGCGIVAQSIDEKELQEINNKLGALRNAIEVAKTIGK